MTKLNLSEWANIAEITASIVIVASLAYVALELDQNTQALQQSSYQDALDTLTQGDFMMSSDKELHRLVKTGENDPSKLSDEQWSQFKHFSFPRMGVWEYTFLAHQEGAISEIQWAALEPYFRDIYCSAEGYRRFFMETKVAWSKDFYRHLEQQVKPSCD